MTIFHDRILVNKFAFANFDLAFDHASIKLHSLALELRLENVSKELRRISNNQDAALL